MPNGVETPIFADKGDNEVNPGDRDDIDVSPGEASFSAEDCKADVECNADSSEELVISFSISLANILLARFASSRIFVSDMLLWLRERVE